MSVKDIICVVWTLCGCLVIGREGSCLHCVYTCVGACTWKLHLIKQTQERISSMPCFPEGTHSTHRGFTFLFVTRSGQTSFRQLDSLCRFRDQGKCVYHPDRERFCFQRLFQIFLRSQAWVTSGIPLPKSGFKLKTCFDFRLESVACVMLLPGMLRRIYSGINAHADLWKLRPMHLRLGIVNKKNLGCLLVSSHYFQPNAWISSESMPLAWSVPRQVAFFLPNHPLYHLLIIALAVDYRVSKVVTKEHHIRTSLVHTFFRSVPPPPCYPALCRTSMPAC